MRLCIAEAEVRKPFLGYKEEPFFFRCFSTRLVTGGHQNTKNSALGILNSLNTTTVAKASIFPINLFK